MLWEGIGDIVRIYHDMFTNENTIEVDPTPTLSLCPAPLPLPLSIPHIRQIYLMFVPISRNDEVINDTKI
jgi:hypothetical protein